MLHPSRKMVVVVVDAPSARLPSTAGEKSEEMHHIFSGKNGWEERLCTHGR
jgi:hypothetical protein